jgi:phosphohistidine phosphatase
MLLYLARHADANSSESDPQRGLSPKGRGDIARVARHLANAKVKVDRIYHSPKLRAMQTAVTLRNAINPRATIEPAAGLLPMDDPRLWAVRLAEMSYESIQDDVMLVGHLPHMWLLSARLMSCGAEAVSLIFETAAVVCLQLDEEHGSWHVRWMITPEVAP